MTLMLVIATFGVLTFLGLSCRRARLDLEEQICDCLHPSVPAAVGYGSAQVPMRPALTRIDGGREPSCESATARRGHLRVVVR
jgi:hypothetical protein